jgi:hypothetical protein
LVPGKVHRTGKNAAEIEMSKGKPILWTPTEKQREFLACPAREVLFAGSVGSGKTDAILMAALSQAKNPKHRALILRRAFPMLRDLIGRSHELFLPLGATFNKGTSQWTFPSGAILEFGFLDADEDKFRYMGRQFSFIGWDELTSWPGDSTDAQGQPVSAAFIYMLTRLRAVEGSNLRLEVRATCTPGGVGHAWVKARWKIPDDGGSSEVIDPATGFRRVFIRATIKDNPFLANTEYARALEALPSAQRKALVEGRWDVFEGAVFSEWNPQIHVYEPFDVPASWPRWRGADDGYAAPFACLWLVHDRDASDTIYVVREAYQSGLTPADVAHAVLAIDREPGGDWRGVIDPAAFADVGTTGDGSRGEQMNKLGCRWRAAEKGAGSVVAGLSAIHSRLQLREDGTPGLRIFRDRCPNLVRELTSLVYDPRGGEAYDGSCADHAVAALRYSLMNRPAQSGRARVIF